MHFEATSLGYSATHFMGSYSGGYSVASVGCLWRCSVGHVAGNSIGYSVRFSVAYTAATSAIFSVE